MADNGKTNLTGGPVWGSTPDEKADEFAQIATRQDVANYVVNAFKTWHEPDHHMLMRALKTLDTMLLFMQEKGLSVGEDGRVYLKPEDIQAWADRKQAEAAAAATPKEQQA